jgi:hypothetical protein
MGDNSIQILAENTAGRANGGSPYKTVNPNEFEWLLRFLGQALGRGLDRRVVVLSPEDKQLENLLALAAELQARLNLRGRLRRAG